MIYKTASLQNIDCAKIKNLANLFALETFFELRLRQFESKVGSNQPEKRQKLSSENIALPRH